MVFLELLKKYCEFCLAIFSTSLDKRLTYALKKSTSKSSWFKSYGGQTEVCSATFYRKNCLRKRRRTLSVYEPCISSCACIYAWFIHCNYLCKHVHIYASLCVFIHMYTCVYTHVLAHVHKCRSGRQRQIECQFSSLFEIQFWRSRHQIKAQNVTFFVIYELL